MNLDDIFKSDQGGAASADLAKIFGTYYNDLITHGVPPQLAAQMVEDYHWLLTCHTLFEDGKFPPRS